MAHDSKDGEREMASIIVYDDKADLLGKLETLTDQIRAGGDFIPDHPTWLLEIKFNCCGGGGP